MSAYHQQNTIFEDEDCLVKALAEHGYGPGTVEINKEPQTLYDYVGKARPQKAHVILRRKYVAGASNDIGFFKNANGKYESIISAYDQGRHGQSWMTGLTKTYAEHALIKQAPRLGMRFVGRTINAKTGKPEIKFRVSR